MSTLSDKDRAALKHELFKSGVVSALFSLFKSRKNQAAAKGRKYLLQDMANSAGVTKAQVSRWFNGEMAPNWRLTTVFDIAEALDGEIRFEIVDRRTGAVHTARGIERLSARATDATQISPAIYVGSHWDLRKSTAGVGATSASSLYTFAQVRNQSEQTLDTPYADLLKLRHQTSTTSGLAQRQTSLEAAGEDTWTHGVH